MKDISRRSFLASSGSLALTNFSLGADNSSALNGYSPGNQLSKIDGLELLNLWGKQPKVVQNLFTLIDTALSQSKKCTYANVARDQKVQEFCKRNNIRHLGGPMLGCVTQDGAKVWVRTVRPSSVKIKIKIKGSSKIFGPVESSEESDLVASVQVDGLKPGKSYSYEVLINGEPIPIPVKSSITTLPVDQKVRIAFGTCPHRWGLGNQKQADRILKHKPSALLMYGDLGSQDKNEHVGKHRSDYQIRDLFPAWQSLSGSIPTFTSWDDHDYFDNDRSGIPKNCTNNDRLAVRKVFSQAWNNPSVGFNDDRGGIFFRTRLGPCDVIMLDNRYFRTGEKRGFLGNGQTEWLKEQLLDCKGEFIIITCGTMWTDHISKGKDSWGKFDPEGREELFQFIEKNRIPGVLLLSGDRHGACGFRIPRPSGHTFYEFEAATLGGRSGPASGAMKHPDALYAFGSTYAFGEPNVDASLPDPEVNYRLIHESGKVLYELSLKRSELTPPA